jgi:hypothetical protein
MKPSASHDPEGFFMPCAGLREFRRESGNPYLYAFVVELQPGFVTALYPEGMRTVT